MLETVVALGALGAAVAAGVIAGSRRPTPALIPVRVRRRRR